jgi:hypothetical protein
MAFSLHALAAQKMPQLQNHLRRHAAEKPAIHARCSKTNPSSSQTADEVNLRCGNINGCFGNIDAYLSFVFVAQISAKVVVC